MSVDSIISIKLIVALIGCVFVIAFSHIISIQAIWNYLGKSSLAIYVLHGLAIAGTRSIITRLWKGSDLFGLIPLVTCTLLGVILPLIAYEASKRIWKLDFFFLPGKYIKINK